MTVKKVQPGRDLLVTRVHTDAKGRYWAHGDVEYTTYYAKLSREKRGGAEMLCGGDRSSSITIAQADPG